jgi:hypothetical protein
MEKINSKIKLHIQFGIFATIWIILLLAGGVTSLLDLVNVAKKFPLAVTVYSVLALIFTKWAWRWKIFQGWLVKAPNLQGTWRGTIDSTWENPATNSGTNLIPAILSIKQTFDNIDCLLFSKESSSYSMSAEINLDQSGNPYLSYNYTNRSRASVRERSEVHDGAAILRIIKSPDRSLEGEYWTSRKSTGEMRFRFESKSIAEKFTE